MAKHFLRVEIGDDDSFFAGGSEMTESQKVPIGETESVHVGCIDELFTRRPCVSVEPMGLNWRERVQTQSKDFFISAHLANEISQRFARN